MPGRQAHGRPLLANPNKKRKSGGGAKKSNGGGSASGSGGAPLSLRTAGGAPKTRQGGRVDVMALAEKQITERRMKGVRTRDLQIDRDSKRRRGDDDEEEDEEDDEDDEEQQGGASKRRRPNNDGDSSDEIHSDSDGNEWREGVGADDDDSEIDSDEAFGDSDDEMFDAFSFRGSTANQQKPKKAKKQRKAADEFDGFDNPSDYSDEDVGDDGEELGDDAIDLAAALDIVSSDEDEAGEASAKARKSKKTKKSKSKKQADSDDDMSDASATSPQSGSGSDDSDDASDESISGSESDDEDSDEESDEDEDDDDEGVFAKSDALKSIASAYAGDDSDEEDSDADMAHSSANPYKFNASLGALTTKDRNLKKSLKATATSSSDKTLNVPLLPMQQDEKERVAAAGKAHETLDRWTDTVKHNRRAEHLTFDVAGSLASTGLDTTTLTNINSQKNAQTDLERTILSIMEESGLGAREQEDARHQEKLRKQQELADNPPVLSPDELKALIGQKRRERELKSQEVARAKRIKKIKSKAYRRVHRRERQRAEQMLADSDAEHDSDGNADSDAEREAQHRQRAMERMGSRHRDSKWAKKGKGTNRAAWDEDYRAGLVDMARQDEELRRRVDGAGVGGKEVGKGGDDDEDDDDDSYGEESDDDKFRERTKQKLEALSSKGEEPKGLMGIAFMRKAEDARKKENDDAVAEIMRDLNRGSDDEDGDQVLFADENNADEDAVVGRRTYGPVAGAGATAAQVQQRAKKSKASAEDKTPAPVAPAAPAAQSSGFAESTPRVPTKVSAPGDAGSWTVVPSKNASKKKEPKSSKLTTVANSDSLAGVTTDGRLVLEAVVDDVLEQNAVARERAALAKSAPAPAQNGFASDTSSSGSDSEDDAGPRTGGGASVGRVDKNGNVVQFRGQNEKLLLKALGEDHAAAEFAAEKVRQAAEEAEAWEEERSLGKKKKNEFMSGWGSWTGDGLSKRTIKAQEEKKAKMMDVKGEKKALDKKIAGRKDAKLERVIISERRVRKTEKYLASTLPHEFETRSQYERSLRLPVGPEWSTTFAFQDATKPRVLKKQGVVLPMSKPAL